ncbi:MAG: LysM peptidoglycan-binding domain-containing protein, partial [Anaerolineaceae bacterium]
SIIELPSRAPSQVTWTKEQSVERGALLFANNCRTCHGIKGQGGVGLPLNSSVSPAARNFQSQDPLILKANQALLRTTISCGRAGSVMPAWLKQNNGPLNNIQIEHLIDLITSPIDEKHKDDEGIVTSEGWLLAVEFAQNLNRETNGIVGGDTLDTIAKAHGIGPKELAGANKLPVSGILKQGSKLVIPAFKGQPDGYTYNVYNDNETIAKVAESQHVGAAIIADLNNLPYKFSEAKGKATLQLLNKDGAKVTGLFPGDKLKLPEGSAYTVAPGDTLDAIAKRHNVSTSAISSLNAATLGGVDSTKPLDAERKLTLPSGVGVVVQAGQTLGVIATQHGLKPDDLAKENGLDATAIVNVGDKLKLPADTKYVIQTGDTLADVATGHGIPVADLASANKLQATDGISPAVVLAMPQVDQYDVKGDSLDAVAKTYSNVTKESLGKANGIAGDAVIRIGTLLTLPPDTWGSAPPDAKNPGTACVQHAIPESSFAVLPGVGTPKVDTPVVAPTTISKDVKIEAHANDWTVTADGTAQPINKGVVAVAKGAAIPFSSVAGLHSITINGKKDGDDLKQGASRSVTFSTTGQFKITCDYHPDMLAYVFVQ